MSIPPAPADPDFVERRRARRGACAHEATVRQRGRFAVAVTITDLTTHGCRVDGAGPFEPGGELWVRLPGLESQASHVAWSQPGLSGARFLTPLHPAVAARFLPASSRFELVAEAAPAGEILPVELAGLSRRERIVQGYGAADAGPLRLTKTPTAAGMFGMIKRQVARRTEYRREERFSDALRTGPMRLSVGERTAQVHNVSASGLRLGVELDAVIGERVAIEFEGFTPLDGTIVWLRAGEAGVSLPRDSIGLAGE